MDQSKKLGERKGVRKDIVRRKTNLAKGLLVLSRAVALIVTKLGATDATIVTGDLIGNIRPGEVF